MFVFVPLFGNRERAQKDKPIQWRRKPLRPVKGWPKTKRPMDRRVGEGDRLRARSNSEPAARLPPGATEDLLIVRLPWRVQLLGSASAANSQSFRTT